MIAPRDYGCTLSRWSHKCFQYLRNSKYK